MLLFLFAILGASSRRSVEICAGDGIECNSANLVIDHGWEALLVDGSESNVATGLDFYRRQSVGLRFQPPRFECAWVTAENVNGLVSSCGFAGEVDLLSIDVDGMDYWIWRALTCISPAVVVAEFNVGLGSELAVTLPYRPDYVHDWNLGYPISPSLAAMTKCAAEKDYRLVACDRFGINAFFVRNDLAEGILPARAPAELVDPRRSAPHPTGLVSV